MHFFNRLSSFEEQLKEGEVIQKLKIQWDQ